MRNEQVRCMQKRQRGLQVNNLKINCTKPSEEVESQYLKRTPHVDYIYIRLIMYATNVSIKNTRKEY
jgi:hypothetical protein